MLRERNDSFDLILFIPLWRDVYSSEVAIFVLLFGNRNCSMNSECHKMHQRYFKPDLKEQYYDQVEENKS